jgi:hypothetical protein
LVRKDVVQWFMLALMEELTSDPPVENTEARGAKGFRKNMGHSEIAQRSGRTPEQPKITHWHDWHERGRDVGPCSR